MFGLSWDQIILILLAALFLLGPERIPTAVRWVMESLRKLRTMAAGAQDELRSQIGPELDELRRQVAELQSLKELKELQELRALRELNPRTIIGKNILGDQFSGGVTGFLGLNGAGSPANGTDGTDGTGSAGGAAAGAAGVPGSNGVPGADGAAGAPGPDRAARRAGGPAAGSATDTATRVRRTLAQGETPPFDAEGT